MREPAHADNPKGGLYHLTGMREISSLLRRIVLTPCSMASLAARIDARMSLSSFRDSFARLPGSKSSLAWMRASEPLMPDAQAICRTTHLKRRAFRTLVKIGHCGNQNRPLG